MFRGIEEKYNWLTNNLDPKSAQYSYLVLSKHAVKYNIITESTYEKILEDLESKIR